MDLWLGKRAEVRRLLPFSVSCCHRRCTRRPVGQAIGIRIALVIQNHISAHTRTADADRESCKVQHELVACVSCFHLASVQTACTCKQTYLCRSCTHTSVALTFEAPHPCVCAGVHLDITSYTHSRLKKLARWQARPCLCIAGFACTGVAACSMLCKLRGQSTWSRL